jgi:hypothetical protein
MTNGSPSITLTGTGESMAILDDLRVEETLGAFRVHAAIYKINNITINMGEKILKYLRLISF